MRLFFDARYIRTDFHDGISRYTTELANALASITDVTFIVCDETQLEYLPTDAAHVWLHKPTSMKEPFASLLIQKYEPDVVFSPLQSFGTLLKRFPLILTIHDLIYYRHRTPPSQFNPFVRLAWRLFYLSYWPQRIALNSAEMVATVSDTSEDQIHEANLTKRPTVVIPNAPRDLTPLVDHHPTFDTNGPRSLIYMGSFMAYKNVETLIASMRWLPRHTLHLLSRIDQKRQTELERLIPEGASVVFHNGVSDETYAKLLTENAVLVTASLDEGYGLPIAEALALGVPVVVSDLPIFHEVAGKGGLYVNPRKPHKFASAVRLLDDGDTREAQISEGFKHIGQFSWQASARELFRAAKSLT